MYDNYCVSKSVSRKLITFFFVSYKKFQYLLKYYYNGSYTLTRILISNISDKDIVSVRLQKDSMQFQANTQSNIF